MNTLIERDAQLEQLSSEIKSLIKDSGVIGVDTEFLREKTYSAKLCLVQLAIADRQYCVDVLALQDLEWLRELMAAPNVVKIFHAARQDIEVIYQTLGVIPRPIFDTQLAAAFCGGDLQQGYGGMVDERLDVQLAKSQSRTDWSRRPLSEEQIKYAAEDVIYLETLYDLTLAELEKNGRLQWFMEELETYYEIEKYQIDPTKAWQRLSGGHLRIKQQYALQALAEWREQTALDRDIPRSWVVRDDKLYDLVHQQPSTTQEIQELGVFGRKSSVYLAPQALAVMKEVKAGEDRIWRKIEALTKKEKSICSAAMGELRDIAEQLGIAQGLLATRKDIESLFRHRQSKKLLRGWRDAVVGQKVLDFMRTKDV